METRPADSVAAEPTSRMTVDRHRPVYHFTASSGWINDPNGLAYYNGRYHLYYQYNPDQAKWGNIHWGHTSSADLVHWRDEPVALTPSPGHDAGGCFSGSFALVGGIPTIYYTGYTSERQVQCIATSRDMRTWTKQPQHTIVNRPDGIDAHDFRDPYVFFHDDWWYMVIGASPGHERGQCLLYRSADGLNWHYRRPLFTSPDLNLGVMWECPNFFPIGDRWVLTVSLWQGLGAHWFVGRFENEAFIAEGDGVLDVDAGSFAHLAMRAPGGRTLQWGWINEQRDQSEIDCAGWAGAMSVPRELSIDADNRLNLRPIREIDQLRHARTPLTSTGEKKGELHRFAGRHLDIEANFTLRDRQKVGLTLLMAEDGSELTRIVFWPDARRLFIERSHGSTNPQTRRQDVWGTLILHDDEPLCLRVLLDGSVLEVYANHRLCLTTRIYPENETSTLGSVFVDGDADVALNVWTMGSLFSESRPVNPDPAL